MSDVRVSDIKVTLVAVGEPIACFEFHQTHRTPSAWEITGSIYSADAKQAVRACLLACLAELNEGSWEAYDIEAESGGATNDQPQLPWE